jgi:signal transduction histidine kinase
VGTSILNITAISLYRFSLKENFYRSAEMELKMARYQKSYSLPPYIKISKKPLLDKNLELLPQTLNGKFVYLDWSLGYKKIKDLAINLFLWETALVLSLTFLFYKILWVHLKEREENRIFLEMILLTLSHKLGNFLATQRLNIEILKETTSPAALNRLEKSYMFIEKEFKHTLNIIKNFKAGSREREKINLKSLVESTLVEFEDVLKDKELKSDLADVIITGCKTDIEMIFYLVIENAVKYAKRQIFIQLKKGDNFVSYLIKNDIDPQIPKGSGIGLALVRQLTQKHKIEFTPREENRYFIVKFSLPVS